MPKPKKPGRPKLPKGAAKVGQCLCGFGRKM